MDKLITSVNGGFPWTLDDFRFQTDESRAALSAILGGLIQNETGNARLFGVEITGSGSTLDVSAGWLLVAGELVRVDAHTVANVELGGDFYDVTITDTFDPAHQKALEDGGVADVRRQRRASLVVGFGSPGATAFTSSNFPQITDRINDLETNFGNWVQINVTTLTPSPGTVTVNSGAIRYKKTGRVMNFAFKFEVEYSSPNGLLTFNLPAALDPVFDCTLCIGSLVDGDGARKLLRVYSDSGTIYFKKTDDTIFDTSNPITMEGSFTYEVAL